MDCKLSFPGNDMRFFRKDLSRGFAGAGMKLVKHTLTRSVPKNFFNGGGQISRRKVEVIFIL
jgi:hypothetical protein